MLGIEINGKDRFFNQLDILPSLLSKAAYNSMYELAETTIGNAESILQSSMKHSSGELAGSLKMEVEQDNSGNVDARVWSDKAGAVFYMPSLLEIAEKLNCVKSVKTLLDKLLYEVGTGTIEYIENTLQGGITWRKIIKVGLKKVTCCKI